MKKFGKMRVIIPFLCAVLFVWSCSQKDVSTQESTIGRTGVSDLFFQNLEIAKVHSSGLEFVYERISKMAGDDASSAAQSAILAGFMAATGVGAPGAGAAICASAVVGSAWGATARALGI